MKEQETIKKAAACIREAEAILVLSGAGMGVDSGLPDFRGKQGFWQAYPAIQKLAIDFSQMANPQWFVTHPQLAWAFYGHRLHLYRKTIPHHGYQLLLKWARDKGDAYFAFTSNVDGQLQKAGFDPQRLVECHGSIHHLQCCKPCQGEIWSANSTRVQVDMEKFLAEMPLPYCPHCQGLARPNILMFGDWSWLSQRSDEQSERMSHWLHSVHGRRLAIIECGAGLAVPTVRHFSERVISEYGGILIRINPCEAQTPLGHLSLSMNAKDALECIDEMIKTDGKKTR